MTKKIKMKIPAGIAPDTALEKALTKYKAKSIYPLRSAYLRALQDESSAIYDMVVRSMIKEITEIIKE